MFKRLVTRALLVACAATVLGAAPAFAEAPWFHLSSGARPTYLFNAGQARDEIQEVKVSATSGDWYFGGLHSLEQLLPYDATHQEVQAQLEDIYGAGDALVEEGRGDTAETHSWTIKFVGERSDQPVSLEVGSFPENIGLYNELKLNGAEGNVTALAISAGRPDGEIIATAINVGNAEANAKGQAPLRLVDRLPAGLKAVSVEAVAGKVNVDGPVQCSLERSTPTEAGAAVCTLAHALPPFAQIEVRIGVVVEGAQTGALNEVSVSGGEAQSLAVKRPITISAAPVPFGTETYELTPEEAGGAADTQAGSHPFQLTTTFTLDQNAGGLVRGLYEAAPPALAKDLSFRLPPGLIGNPHPIARCTLAQFSARPAVQCPQQTVLGVAVVTIDEPANAGLFTISAPLYNLEPTVGEPARFGFLPTHETPVFLDTAVRTGEDYGVTVTVPNITQEISFLSSSVTFWGVPGAASHDGERGADCLASAQYENATGPCQPLGANSPPPFLDLPTSCSGEPLHTEVLVDSWDRPSERLPLPASQPMPRMDGCNQLPFHSEIEVTPDVQEASKPSGLTVDVHIPQEEALNPEGLAPSEVKDITVALPEGLGLNPAAADGLQACTQAQVALDSDAQATCPNASKIANVEIDTPLLPDPLKGFVYLASPQNFREGPTENPFATLVAMYLVAEDPISGTLIKLPGAISLNQGTGQITSTFANDPQLPFEDAKLEFFGGERAPLATPARCGTYTTNASFVPWSAQPEDAAALTVASVSTFEIASAPGGGPCESPLPFDPSLASGTTNINAGAFSALTTTLSRADDQQPIQSVTLHYPAGLSGLLSGVKLCGEAQAEAGTCGSESEIGETIVSVGVGGDPFTVTGGKVYITGPYEGAPFGLSIVNPAKAGPFDLQEGRPIVVRARIEVNPTTAALTITTNSQAQGHAIPTIVEGFALQIQHVNVLINRPGFTFNPTDCKPMAVTGSVNSAEGASSPVSVPFQVTNCASLKFKPKFAVSTSGKTSRLNGASLTAKVSEPSGPQGSQANLSRVKVELPKQLPSRLTTLQKACRDTQFEADPAGCPAASRIGYATVRTPLLPVPLSGPAIFVSHGGEAFPSLTMVLQGDNVTIVLVGATYISPAGVTSTTFKTVPDQPFSSFELTLPEGPYSALSTNTNLCGLTHTVTVKKTIKRKVHGRTRRVVERRRERVAGSLKMPTEFVAQNGATLRESTTVGVTGCPQAKRASKKGR